jgi:hypothetical protein
MNDTELERLVNNGKQLEADLVNTPLSEQRMTICSSCESLLKSITVCKECYCYMPWKTKIDMAKCPLNKW